eukprot:153664-Chlamydomonas_euryale.AAC.7
MYKKAHLCLGADGIDAPVTSCPPCSHEFPDEHALPLPRLGDRGYNPADLHLGATFTRPSGFFKLQAAWRVDYSLPRLWCMGTCAPPLQLQAC